MISLSPKWVAEDLFEKRPPGLVRVASIYDHVINIYVESSNQLLMLAGTQMFKGPSSAGLGDKEFRILQNELAIGDPAVFDGESIEFPGAAKIQLLNARRVSFGVPQRIEFDRQAFISNSATVAQLLKKQAAPHLCSVLLEATNSSPALNVQHPAHFKESDCFWLFGKSIKAVFSKLVDALIDDNRKAIEEYVEKIAGLGFGSSPTGDDLIHGALLAMHYNRYLEGSSWNAPDFKFDFRTRTTSLGAHMIAIAMRGLTPEPVLAFIKNVLEAKPVFSELKALSAMGSDSGISIATGFFLATAKYWQKTV